MSEYNIQMNKYNALNAEYDQLYPATKIANVDGLGTALQNKADASSVYSKEESISASTRTALNLAETATPDAALAEIARQLTVTVESTDYPGCYYRIVDGVTEWVNPPMLLGVEYRTTGRYLGKPVYIMVFVFGNLPNASDKLVSIPNSDSKSKIFEISALVNNEYTITGRTGTGDESDHWITAFSNGAYIVTKGDVSSRTAIVYAKYYKTTD